MDPIISISAFKKRFEKTTFFCSSESSKNKMGNLNIHKINRMSENHDMKNGKWKKFQWVKFEIDKTFLGLPINWSPWFEYGEVSLMTFQGWFFCVNKLEFNWEFLSEKWLYTSIWVNFFGSNNQSHACTHS